jgi:hypothetical protein
VSQVAHVCGEAGVETGETGDRGGRCGDRWDQLEDDTRVQTVAKVDDACDALARVVDQDVLIICIILPNRRVAR